MGGKSSSRNSTTQIANDNRVVNNIDSRTFTTIDDRDDNRTFIDNRQDNRVFTTIDDRDDNRVFNDNRRFTTIDDRDDNRVFNDNRSFDDNSTTVGAGAIFNSGAGNITITETTTDHGATEKAFGFAGDAVSGTFGAINTIVQGQKEANAQLVDAIFKNSEGGQAENAQKLAYAGLFAGVSMLALISLRKGF